MITTAGIDIGAGAIKVVLFRTEGSQHEWLAKRAARIMTELLTYSRRVESRVRRLNLHSVLKFGCTFSLKYMKTKFSLQAFESFLDDLSLDSIPCTRIFMGILG